MNAPDYFKRYCGVSPTTIAQRLLTVGAAASLTFALVLAVSALALTRVLAFTGVLFFAVSGFAAIFLAVFTASGVRGKGSRGKAET